MKRLATAPSTESSDSNPRSHWHSYPISATHPKSSGSSLGSGGMATKLKAAGIVTEAGIVMIIANGDDPESLYALLEGKAIGTRFVGKKG